MSLITEIFVKSALVLVVFGFSSVEIRCVFVVSRIGDEARKLFLIFLGRHRSESEIVFTFKITSSPFLVGILTFVSYFLKKINCLMQQLLHL